MKLRVGIVGAGNIAALMAQTINEMEDATCYAIASRTLKKAEQFARDYGVTKAFSSYEELMKAEEVDLVYIATPHSQHYENARLAIRYRKPVLCEKSFTVNAKQAKELLQYAKESNVFITEAIWTRYMPLRKTIKDCLAQGMIGEPRMVTANLGYEISGIDRITNPNLAGGGLLDVGVYPLNFAAMVFGTDIAKVTASCTYTDSGVDENGGMILEYKDGKMAVLNYSTNSVSDRLGIVHGSKGYMVVENINNFENIKIYNEKNNLVQQIERPNQITGYEYEVRACIEALQNAEIQCMQMPHEETIKMMEIMDGLREKWNITYPFEERKLSED